MQKIKSLKWSGLLAIIKSCLIAIITTLIGVVCFAVVLKFTDLSNVFITYVNNIIKIISIFVMVLCLKKRGEDKLLIKAIFGGLLYSVLCFVLFSVLNGSFDFNLSLLYDSIFSIIVAVIASVIINISFKRNN